MSWAVGLWVKARRHITESGEAGGDESAVFPAPDYVHARPGDHGEIVYVDEEGYPTVQFNRTGTATIVGHSDIELVK